MPRLFYQRSCAVLISFFIKRSCRPFVISAQPSSIQRGSLQQACSHSLNCSMSSRAFSGSEDKDRASLPGPDPYYTGRNRHHE